MLTLLTLAGVGLGAYSGLLVTVLVALIVLAVLYWLITSFAPPPIQKYAIAVLVVVAVIFLINFLLQLT